MTGPEEVSVRVEHLRRLLHDVNNAAASVLTKSELALMTSDPAQREAALRRIGELAEELGAYARSARNDLLGDG